MSGEAVAVLGDRHLVLVGLMGTGKSTVGPLLADSLHRPFVDLDDAVAERTGHGVRELLAIDGGGRFRAAEAAALVDLVAGDEPLVIATGGGAVLDADSRVLLRGSPVVVWLQAPTEVLVGRVARDGAPDRPLLDDGPESVLGRLAEERTPLYAEVADVSVDSSSGPPDDVAASVLAAIADTLAGADESADDVEVGLAEEVSP